MLDHVNLQCLTLLQVSTHRLSRMAEIHLDPFKATIHQKLFCIQVFNTEGQIPVDINIRILIQSN